MTFDPAWNTIAANGITAVADDSTPQLSGDLEVEGNAINGKDETGANGGGPITITSGDSGTTTPSFGSAGSGIIIQGGENKSANAMSPADPIQILGGDSTDNNRGQDIEITAGAGGPTGTNQYGGSVYINGGSTRGFYLNGGNVEIEGGAAQDNTKFGGGVILKGGDGVAGGAGRAGDVIVVCGDGKTDGTMGNVIIGDQSQIFQMLSPSDVNIQGGRNRTTGGTTDTGGDVYLRGGWGYTGDASSHGHVYISPPVINGSSDDEAPTELRFQEILSNGGNYIGFKSPASVTASRVLELPDGVGSNGQALTTNGGSPTASLSWSTVLTEVSQDTTPELGGPLVAGNNPIRFNHAWGINDDSNNEWIVFAKTASAVNELLIRNAATGTGASLEASGNDTHIDLILLPKNQGVLSVAGTTDYETNLAADDDIPNLKWVDDNFLRDVVEDTTPQLGGNLDVNNKQITASTLGQTMNITTASGTTNAGAIALQGGASTSGNGGTIGLTGGTGGTTGGSVQLTSGDSPVNAGDIILLVGRDTTDATGDGEVAIGGSTGRTTATPVKFREAAANGGNGVSLKAADTLSGDSTYTLPTTYPSVNGQTFADGNTLVSDGSGTMQWDVVTRDAATLQTTNATTTDIRTFAVASGSAVVIEFTVVAWDSTNSEAGAVRHGSALAQNVAGTTTLVASTVSTDGLTTSGGSVTVDVEDTLDILRIRVTGAASTTIDWKVSVRVMAQ